MRKRTNIFILIDFATGKGGKLLSSEYINSKQPVLWECNKKHQWKAAWSDVRRGGWCKKCNIISLRYCIQDIQQYATSMEGKLITSIYTSALIPMLWECSKGHQWKARWINIKRNQWCPTCAGLSKPNIKELQKVAESKHGKLISKNYINCETKMTWLCEKGHSWNVSWHCVKRGIWCPICAGQIKPDIIELQQVAANKNGKLVSTEYKTNKEKLIWKCKDGHTWKATWHHIKSNNSWCPICANKTYKSELECRNILETHFNRFFPNTRFYYNKHKFIEFDCYNKDLKLAIEYNGEQHYKYVSKFHKTEKDLKCQQLRDKNKIKYCLNNNIKLIIIPYTENKNLKEFILKELNNVY